MHVDRDQRDSEQGLGDPRTAERQRAPAPGVAGGLGDHERRDRNLNPEAAQSEAEAGYLSRPVDRHPEQCPWTLEWAQHDAPQNLEASEQIPDPPSDRAVRALEVAEDPRARRPPPEQEPRGHRED